MFLILLQQFFVFSSPLINALFNYSWSSYCVYNKFTFFRSPRSSAEASSSCPDVNIYSSSSSSSSKVNLEIVVFKFQIHVIRFSNFWCRDVLNIKWFLNNKKRWYWATILSLFCLQCDHATSVWGGRERARDLNAHQLFIFKRFSAMRMRTRERQKSLSIFEL